MNPEPPTLNSSVAIPDVLILGGGVIGLSLAWDLAKFGQKVRLIDRGEPGKEASWAGAGILPPASWQGALHPYDQLRALASELHPHWARELFEQSGVETGFRRCGGIYLARTHGEAASLIAWAGSAEEEGIDAQRLGERELEKAGVKGQVVAAYLLPQEAQLRNPYHLKALRLACERLGVKITAGEEAIDFEIRHNRIAAVITSAGPIAANQFCFTSGAWTGHLAAKIGISLGILPIRGQMVLFKSEEPLTFRHILSEGSRYLVPRDDGHVLAGSTEEEVGFDKGTTDEGLTDLIGFARGLVPALKDAAVEKTWAGLRPASFDGAPYIGPLTPLSNAYVAAGHFRSGLFLSPATAIVMSQLLRGERPIIDLAPFRVLR